jgi:hypothetical protein
MGPPAEEARTGRPAGEVPDYSRQLPYQMSDWRYDAAAVKQNVSAREEQWTMAQRLVDMEGVRLADLLDDADLLYSSELGPYMAALVVEEAPGRKADVVAKLGGLLTGGLTQGAAVAPGFERTNGEATRIAHVDAAARRAAVTALRSLGGADAEMALFVGLVGPERQRVRRPSMPPEMMGIDPEIMAAARPKGQPVAKHIARALGSMGRDDLLRTALNAPQREFYNADRMGVQTAALAGMAYLPTEKEPQKQLIALLRQASTPQLRAAIGEAITVAVQAGSAQ